MLMTCYCCRETNTKPEEVASQNLRRWGVTEIQDIREHQCHLQFVSGKVRLFNMYFAA